MDRLAKATLLLELAPPGELVAALQEHDPQRFAQYKSSRPSVDATGRSPYRGLSAFQLDEAHLFFGREALTGALWQRLEALHEKADATRLLAIVGPSLTGAVALPTAGRAEGSRSLICKHRLCLSQPRAIHYDGGSIIYVTVANDR